MYIIFIVQCTLDYPGADYSVCGLSVHYYFFNLPSMIHTIRYYKMYTE
jgi:hypothetical protein